MAILSDLSSYLTWAEESSYADDSGLSVDSRHGLIKTVKPKANRNYITIDKGIGGGSRAPHEIITGLLDASLSETFTVQDGKFLEHALGARTGAGTSGDPYAYATSLTPPSLTMEYAANTITSASTWRLLGAYNASTRIGCELGQEVIADMEWVGKTIKTGTTYQSISAASTKAYVFIHGTLETPTSTTIAEVQSVNIEITNPILPNPGIGGVLQPQIVGGGQSYKGSIKLRMISDDWQDIFLTGSSGATEPTDGDATALASMTLNLTKGSFSLKPTLTNVRIDWSCLSEKGQLIDQEIPFEAEAMTASEVDS